MVLVRRSDQYKTTRTLPPMLLIRKSLRPCFLETHSNFDDFHEDIIIIVHTVKV